MQSPLEKGGRGDEMGEGGKASSAGPVGAASAPASVRPAAGASPAAAAPSVDPLIGRLIDGRFLIHSLIARGGMGRVYRAEQAPLGRVCAIKILTTTYEGEHDPEFHKRFFLEASIASKITHPNSVTIFDYGHTSDDVYYMAMEYLEGVTLHRAIRTSAPFHESRVAHIARQVCRALREAHALGCIHRDLKPANIFLTEHGDEPDFVKVLDFGLVKNVAGEGKPDEQLTQTGLFMGSPKYMAPEQIRGDRVDARTDVYSLGIIMYEMLTGKVPFERMTSLNTLMAQVNDKPPRLQETNPDVQVSPEVEELVLRCMAKDPNERAGSMDEVLAALKRVVGSGNVGLTGEYRALGVSGSGQFSRIDPLSASSRFPSSMPAMPASRPASDAAASDGPSVSVSMSALPLKSPSLTPLLDGAGGGSVSVHPASVPPPDFRAGRGRAIGAVIAGLVVLGGGALLATRIVSRAGPVATATSSALPAPTFPSTPAPTPSASAAPAILIPSTPIATTLSVHFVTDPPGASVKENGEELCPSTPCDHAFAADMSVEHKVVIARAGFRPETRVLKGTDSQLAVTLAPQRAWVAPKQPTTKPADPGGAAPQGFKDIPY